MRATPAVYIVIKVLGSHFFFTPRVGAAGPHWNELSLPNPALLTWHVYGSAAGWRGWRGISQWGQFISLSYRQTHTLTTFGVSTCTVAHVCICSSACTNTTSVKCVQCTCANVFLQHHKHALCTHCTFKPIHVNFELPVLSFLTHTCTKFASSVSASCRGDGEVSLSDFEQNPPVACPSHSPWHV